MGTLASGVYYGVKTYKVTGFASFSNYYEDPPVVWIRDRTTKGWSGANPKMQTPWVNITHVTNTGFYYETFVYWIGTNSAGQSINAYYPASPSQSKIDFTVVGIPGEEPLSASISGESHFGQGNPGQWWAIVSGGDPPYNITCSRSYNGGSGPWSQVGTGDTYSQIVNQEKWLRIWVTDGNCTPGFPCLGVEDVLHIKVNTCGNPPCPMPLVLAVNSDPIPETFAH